MANASQRGFRPLPSDWQDARDLLRELLDAFGLAATPRSDKWPTKRHVTGVVADHRPDGAHDFGEQVEAMRPLLERLTDRVRALGPRPDLRRVDPAHVPWFEVVDEWNGAIRSEAAYELPPLCVECGRPVLQRAPHRLGGGDVDLGEHCSDRCRNRRKAREHKRDKRRRAARAE